MNTEFSDIQRIGNWIYILLGVDLLVVSFILYREFKNGTTSLNELLVTIGIILVFNTLIVLFIRMSALQTKVDKQGVHYKYPPFCIKWKVIPFEKISDFQIQNYSSMNHGYSVGKWNLFSKTDRITAIGTDKVIKIDYNSKKPILISSQKASEFYNAIKKFKSREDQL
ncbi:MAG TPA: hypothetical protein VKZ97_00520 [Flavobacteriaceae bacterium]|nr:hypothetical protein [Flavobacteriaceae bacterium]